MNQITSNACSTQTSAMISVGSASLQLNPTGSVYWEAENSLLVADLHLGKETSFRKAGMPLPGNASAKTCRALLKEISHFQPTRVIVLGDLVHARCSWSQELEEIIAELCNSCRIDLIVGNHDLGSRMQLQACGLILHEPYLEMADLQLIHDPGAVDAKRLDGNSKHIVAGHLHPGLRLGSATTDSVQLKCFLVSPSLLVLPAYGFLTGAKCLPLENAQTAFVIADNALLKVNG